MYYLLPQSGKPENTDAYFITGKNNYTNYLEKYSVRTDGTACLKDRNSCINCYLTSLKIAYLCLTKGIIAIFVSKK